MSPTSRVTCPSVRKSSLSVQLKTVSAPLGWSNQYARNASINLFSSLFLSFTCSLFHSCSPHHFLMADPLASVPPPLFWSAGVFLCLSLPVGVTRLTQGARSATVSFPKIHRAELDNVSMWWVRIHWQKHHSTHAKIFTNEMCIT